MEIIYEKAHIKMLLLHIYMSSGAYMFPFFKFLQNIICQCNRGFKKWGLGWTMRIQDIYTELKLLFSSRFVELGVLLH